VHLDHQTPEPMPETGPPIEPGAASGGTTLGEERAAPDGAETAPSSDQLRQELLAIQERLDAIIRSGEQVHATAAADAVATQRLAQIAQRLREFDAVVRARRRTAGRRRPWHREFWRRSTYPALQRRDHPSVRARRELEAEHLRTFYRAGLLHLW